MFQRILHFLLSRTVYLKITSCYSVTKVDSGSYVNMKQVYWNTYALHFIRFRQRSKPKRNMQQLSHEAYNQEAPRDYNSATIQKSRDQMDPYGTNENNYFRTWQLPQRSGRSIKNSELPPPPYVPASTLSGGSDSSRYRHVEHVYESPKFDRREMAQSGSGDLTTGSAQYFELDPEAANMGQRSLPRSGHAQPDIDNDLSWMAHDEQPENSFSPR